MPEKNIFQEALDSMPKSTSNLDEMTDWFAENAKAVNMALQGYSKSVEDDKWTPRFGG